MTTTQVDEQVHHFYHKFGYIDKDSLSFDSIPLEKPMEMFLLKNFK